MFIIWTGHGILIPIFGIVGLVGGSALMLGLAAVLHLGTSSTFGLYPVGGGIGAAAMVWLYALTLGKTVEQRSLDPATGRPVIVQKRHTFFFIPAIAWAIIASVCGMAFAGSGLLSLVAGKVVAGMPVSSAPGAAALHEAEQFVAAEEGNSVLGNTPEATKMGMEFSTIAEAFANSGFQLMHQPAFPEGTGAYVTYCQSSSYGTLFIVHPPQKRLATRKSKDGQVTAAWAAAQVAAAKQQPPPARLAIAIPGDIFYDTIIIGTPVADYGAKLDAHQPEAGILTRYTETDNTALRRFFVDEPPSVPDKVAPRDADTKAPTATPGGKS